MKRSLVLSLSLLLCAGCEFLKKSEPPTTPTPPANEVHYTALGASDAIGFGSTVVCLPFSPCPTGTGYVQAMHRQFEQAGKTVQFMNLGMPGAVLGPETRALGASVGRDPLFNFLDGQVPFVPRDSTVITVFAGANDINIVGAALKAGLGGSNIAGYIQTQTQIFARDLQALVNGIRDRAPEARLVVINLPNLGAMPYVSGNPLVEKQALQQISVAFSAQVNALTSRGVFVIDLMCDAQMYQSNMFSSDGFHPNDAGYARLAAITFPVASGGAAAAPRATCSQMTVF